MKLSIDSIYSCMSKSISKQEYLPRFIIILYSLPSLLLLGNSLLLIRRYEKYFPFLGTGPQKTADITTSELLDFMSHEIWQLAIAFD